jgi:Iap family predicted aminopeptidase
MNTLIQNLQQTVNGLCSEACAGRSPGSAGGRAARRIVHEALRNAGCAPTEQAVPGCDGANVLAAVKGDGGRWVMVGAHYDHLGQHGSNIYFGADDNAAAVAIMIEVGRALAANPPKGRSVLLAAFDGEEPPHFHTAGMGSAHFVSHPTVPLEQIDLMVCMDLVGHAVGPVTAPPEVRQSVFALGAERSEGTSAIVDALSRAQPGVVIRRADADVIPPLSDHWAFWHKQVPFLFLTNGRWEHYHQPSDTPDKLDWAKMAATALWLETMVRAACARPDGPVRFANVHDDASTLASLRSLLTALKDVKPDAATGLTAIASLEKQLNPSGQLPADLHAQTQALVEMIELSLA